MNIPWLVADRVPAGQCVQRAGVVRNPASAASLPQHQAQGGSTVDLAEYPRAAIRHRGEPATGADHLRHYQKEHNINRLRWLLSNKLSYNSQSTQSEGTASHQSISEDSAKWSRERRMAQDVLMENVRSGGNGLTVRTVISASKKTVYIIQSGESRCKHLRNPVVRSFVCEFFLLTLRINPSPGKYYSCEDGSEPDVDAFRAQANIHERKCTSGKQAVQLPLLVDPCIDAEAAPLEYSYNNEWMFCLGDAERDATHSPDGDVDCGKKIKATQSLFTDRF